MTDTSRRLLVSFSGGETSALMTKLCHERLSDQYDEILTVFSNTGQEDEATLEFVDRGKLKVEDLRRMAAEGNFTPATDDSRVYPADTLEGLELDLAGGGSESCEVEFEIDDDVQEAA
jgi:3'-phosphoadenosine 5'-phosphosulfate sulfotransferase (PAPS reductase)/FAD synthetase